MFTYFKNICLHKELSDICEINLVTMTMISGLAILQVAKGSDHHHLFQCKVAGCEREAVYSWWYGNDRQGIGSSVLLKF